VMVLRVGVGEQVVADAQPLEQFQEPMVKVFEHLAGVAALLVGDHGDRCAVGIGARDHQDVVAFETVITCTDVTRQV
jgi:hypothetical protein